MKIILYAFVMGGLMYVMLCFISNICFVVEMMSKYQSNEKLKY